MGAFDHFIHKLLEKGLWVERLLLLLSGIIFAQAFAPMNIAPVIFIVFPILFTVLTQAHSKKQAFFRGWWFAFGFFLMGINWIGQSFSQQDFVPPALAPVAVLMMAACLSVYYGLFALSYYSLSQRSQSSPLMRYFLFAALWIVFEYARAVLFTGFPWHLIASLWANWLAVLQSIYYISVYGLGFLTVLLGLLPLMIWHLVEQTDKRQKGYYFILVLTVTLAFTAVAQFGHFRLNSHQPSYHLGATVRVVQGNIKQRQKWQRDQIDDHFFKHAQLSRRRDDRGKAAGVQLLVWPETAVQRQNFDRENSLERYMMSRLLEKGAYALVGAPRYDVVDSQAKYYNSMLAVNHQGNLMARYDKSHLVPFGEYVPFPGLFRLLGLGSLTGGAWSSGDGPHTIDLPGIPAFSPLICYEIIFPGKGVKRPSPGKGRAEWMLNITNDAWFGTSDGPYQHLALAKMRAVEEGLPVVRAANTGVSAVIDPFGRILRQVPIGVAAILDMPLPQAVSESLLSSRQKIIISLIFIFLIPAYTLIAVLLNRKKSHKF